MSQGCSFPFHDRLRVAGTDEITLSGPSRPMVYVLDNTARTWTLDTTPEALNASSIQARATDVLPLIQDIQGRSMRGSKEGTRPHLSRDEITGSQTIPSECVSSKTSKAHRVLGILTCESRKLQRIIYILVRSPRKIGGSPMLKGRRSSFGKISLWDATR